MSQEDKDRILGRLRDEALDDYLDDEEESHGGVFMPLPWSEESGMDDEDDEDEDDDV